MAIPPNVQYDTPLIHAWLKYEGDPEFSRIEGKVKAGEGAIPHGAVMAIETDTGKWVWHKAGATDGSEVPRGISLYAVEATDPDHDVATAILVRDIVVVPGALSWHPSVDTQAERDAALAQLEANRVLTRVSL